MSVSVLTLGALILASYVVIGTFRCLGSEGGALKTWASFGFISKSIFSLFFNAAATAFLVMIFYEDISSPFIDIYLGSELAWSIVVIASIYLDPPGLFFPVIETILLVTAAGAMITLAVQTRSVGASIVAFQATLFDAVIWSFWRLRDASV